MNLIQAFSLNFYEFSCDDKLTDRILSIVEKNNWKTNVSNNVSNDDLFFDTELFDWFDSCLETVKDDLGFSQDISLPITSCWANKTNKLQAHHYHHHSNSFISGIFYLTSHSSSETVFSLPNFYLKEFASHRFKDKQKSNNIFKILPKKSTLVLFPSYVMHSVLGMSKLETRYTLAFNTYIKGEIDDGESRCRLFLQPKSVRDYYET